MNLAEITQTCRVELNSKEDTTIHFGKLSIRLPIGDLKEIGCMFNPREKEYSHDEEVCNVMKSEKGKFIFTYRSIMFTLCGTALSQLARLVETSITTYESMFDRYRAESASDIEQLLTGIEKKFSH